MNDDATGRLARALADVLAEVLRAGSRAEPAIQVGWRERLWTCPADTRLGVVELSEALGRSKALVYRLTRMGQVPHRKLDGELVFRAGDIRAWLAQREDVVVTPRLTVVGRAEAAA